MLSVALQLLESITATVKVPLLLTGMLFVPWNPSQKKAI
jgi:hypothetical protein